MHDHEARLARCIELCLTCHRVCLQTAMSHCLEAGGEHVAPKHFRLMLACAEICGAAARIMLIGEPLHGAVCRACAEICESCANNCAKLDGMANCVEVCRDCAVCCAVMAKASVTAVV